MDTHRLTDPIGGHLAGAATIAAAVADATTGIADTIVDRVGDLDLAGTAERTRRSLMRRVGRDRRTGSRRWALAGAGLALALAGAAAWRRRQSAVPGGPSSTPGSVHSDRSGADDLADTARTTTHTGTTDRPSTNGTRAGTSTSADPAPAGAPR